MKNSHKIISLSFVFFISSISWAENIRQDLDYTDATETLENPGIGFYRTQCQHFTYDNNKATNTWGNLSHLRMDISEFSNKAILKIDETTNDTTFGIARPLSDDMLSAFEATLDNIRQRGKSAIVRFSYDPYFNGSVKCDPEQSVILGHLKQLGEVYARNTDVITYVELGMYGSYGEMHSSNVGTNENIAEALQTLLSCTPPEIKIGVRRPDIIAYWLGVNQGNNYSDFDIHSEKFQQAVMAKGDTIYRVGMYNDGYLGSYSDLGTIGMGASGHQLTREMMIEWLETYSQHTPYGGELVANYNGDNPINTPTYLSNEGFRTHTSYLNYEWHQPTILSWKDSIFNGNDPEYKGATGYTYVENHLGYRFILRDAYLPDSVSPNDHLNGELKIENVGFGNMVQKGKVSFVLKNENNLFEIEPDSPIDPQQWLSRQTTTDSFQLTLPTSIPEGEYDLFIRISKYADLTNDKNYHCIQFGNPSQQYDKNIGANRIGNIFINSKTTDLQETKEANQALYLHDGFLYLSGEGFVSVYKADGKQILYASAYSQKPIDLTHYRGEVLLIVINTGKNSYTYKTIVQ
ncbi:MAG: DUF4832 domain-containing protein [Paludibacteraceae bacterium]|nr:DUF4832 domain-containing protein [Paludibacteraceae bacterium]